MAKNTKGMDEESYRAEFIRLSDLLSEEVTAR